MKSTRARRTEPVLLERDAFVCEASPNPLGHTGPAFAGERATVVGQE
jgi:hypothetical protein